MSYKLTLEFNSFEELKAYVNNGTATTQAGPSSNEEESVEATPAKASISEVAAPKQTRTRKAHVSAPKNEEEMIDVPSPFVETPVEVQAPLIDRDAAIKRASALVAQLKATGIEDAKLMPVIHSVYAKAGCPVNLKISQFDDASLAKFLPMFEAEVASITKPKTQDHLFI